MASHAALAVTAVRERVSRLISTPVSDAEALKICFTCATVECEALLELSHSRVVRTEASTHARLLAITPQEFDLLLRDEGFTNIRRFNLTAALAEDEADPERQRQLEAVRVALKLTLNEPQQRVLWESGPRVRMRVALAILRKDSYVDCLEHALGQILKSDLRLVEDLRCETAEIGIDIIGISALISTVCSHIVT